MATAKNKVKLLICGAVEGNFQALSKKLNSLQKSKAGPFDVCLCSGPFFAGDGNDATTSQAQAMLHLDGAEEMIDLPVPVYFVDIGVLPKQVILEYRNTEWKNIFEVSTKTKKLFYLTSNVNIGGKTSNDYDFSSEMADITILPQGNLVVAHFPARARIGKNKKHPLETKTAHKAYMGCDVLLSSEWGQGIAKAFNASDQSKCSALLQNSKVPVNELGSYDVAEIAAMCKPRYHVSPSMDQVNNLHFAALPYRNSFNEPSRKCHISRFIALGKVQGVKVQKDKKFLHAVNIITLTNLDQQSLYDGVANAMACPYTSDNYLVSGTTDRLLSSNGEKAAVKTGGLSEAAARSIMIESSSSSAGDTQGYRWSSSKRKRQAVKDDPYNNTLHISWRHEECSENIAGVDILQKLAPYGCNKVRLPPPRSTTVDSSVNKFGFLEFESHDKAKSCLMEFTDTSTGNCGMQIGGIFFHFNWGKGGAMSRGDTKKARLTEVEALESSSLFFSVKRKIPELTTDEFSTYLEYMRVIAEKGLEDAIQDGESTSETRLTAMDEPALAVEKSLAGQQNSYGFLRFASHAAASMAVQVLTGSLDGGIIMPDNLEGPYKNDLSSAVLYWAPPPKKGSEKSSHNFHKKHFPADSRKDCWFCLASPTCEQHLIVTVRDTCYVAMPKGPLDDFHALIIPVGHDDGKVGALCGSSAGEVDEVKEQLRSFLRSKLNKEMFVFERALQTKGGYHSHVQCIPLHLAGVKDLYSSLIKMSSNLNLEFREVESDLGLRAIITSSDGEGYFYAEIPTSSGKPRRLICVIPSAYEVSDKKKMSVPLQFGREVAAACMGRKDKIHWKECVLDEKNEGLLAHSFRDLFEDFLCNGKE